MPGRASSELTLGARPPGDEKVHPEGAALDGAAKEKSLVEHPGSVTAAKKSGLQRDPYAHAACALTDDELEEGFFTPALVIDEVTSS